MRRGVQCEREVLYTIGNIKEPVDRMRRNIKLLYKFVN